MKLPGIIADVAKLALKPIELRIDARLILLALLIGAFLYFSHKNTKQPAIESVYAAGTHRIIVLDTDKLSWNLYQDTVTGTTIFCASFGGNSCIILPSEKTK